MEPGEQALIVLLLVSGPHKFSFHGCYAILGVCVCVWCVLTMLFLGFSYTRIKRLSMSLKDAPGIYDTDYRVDTELDGAL